MAWCMAQPHGPWPGPCPGPWLGPWTGPCVAWPIAHGTSQRPGPALGLGTSLLARSRLRALILPRSFATEFCRGVWPRSFATAFCHGILRRSLATAFCCGVSVQGRILQEIGGPRSFCTRPNRKRCARSFNTKRCVRQKNGACDPVGM